MVRRSDCLPMKTSITQSDRGASAILLAISLLLLMGMAAIGIDYGLGANERRHDQTGADTAVMAGAVELVTGGSVQEIVDEIVNFVNINVRPVSSAEWEACTDDPADQLTLVVKDHFPSVTPATPCISFDFLERIRVNLPDQIVETTFGKVIGVDTLAINAEAEALGIVFPGGGAGPPFVALNGSSGGDLICLRTSSSGPVIPPLMSGNGPGTPASLGTEPDPCDDTVYDPASQFFGVLDPLVYFNNATGELTCKSNLTEYLISKGIDHNLTSFEPDYVVGTSNPLGPDVTQDDCSPEAVSGVNTMPLKTGLSAGELRCGMLTSQGGTCATSVSPGAAGGNNVPARLHVGPYVQSTYTFLGESMDNEAIWEFLPNYAGLTWPAECESIYDNQNNAAWDYFDKKEEMLDCLTAWDSSVHDVLFTADLITTPRFAWIPLLAEANLSTDPGTCPLGGGSNCVHFNSFQPVYLQTLYTLITGGGGAGACDPGGGGQRWGRHDGGQQEDCGKSNQNLDRLTSIVLDCAMLPADICSAAPGSPGGDPDPTLELVK